MRYVKVSPHSSNYKAEDVLFIDTHEHPIGHLDLEPWLRKGEPFDMETIENDRIADADMKDYGDTEEKALQGVHEEVAGEWVELLNYVVRATGKEVSERSTFEMTDTNTLDEEDEDNPGDCETCGEPLYKDCQGQPRCETCDPPCPSCDDGGGPV